METYDAQMFDSGDADIPMYSGSLASEPQWFPVEASMTDDGYIVDSYPAQDHPGVEVEMEDHDGEITEYEMADEAEPRRDHDVELLDVEVVDASRVASPRSREAEPLGTDIGSDVTQNESTTVPLDSIDPALPVAQDGPLDAVDSLSAQTALDSAAVSSHTFSAESTNTQPAHVDLLDEAPDTAIARVESLASESAALLEGHTLDTSAASDESAHVESGDDPYADVAEEDELYRGESSGLAAASGSTLLAESTVASSTEQQVEPTLKLAEAEPSNLDDPNSSTDVSLGQYAEATVLHDDGVGAGDPHEISEGVYIDPPPAVLLSIPSSSTLTEYCLFNHPPLSSGSQSPSSGSASQESPRLVLHHRPTLYYESLSAVFEALRQDEHVQGLPEFDNGELVLDAYDLQLVVSEVSHCHCDSY